MRGDGPETSGSRDVSNGVNPTCVGMDRSSRGRGARAVNVNLTHVGSRHFYPLSENEDFQCREEDIVEELTGIA